MAKILLVDDEEDIRFILRSLLEDDKHTILEAENGQKALEMFQKDAFELVITDMKMPNMDGVTLLRKIREIKPDQSVIVCTGSTIDIPEATGVIFKPFSFEKLEQLLKRILG